MPYKNMEDKKLHASEYYRKHKKEINAAAHRYYEQHSEQIKEWNRNNSYEYHRTINGRYSLLKCKARRYGHNFNITKEYYEKVVSRPCYYCGNSLPVRGHGLDRLDNREGYIIGNVVPCCKICNTKKGYLEATGFVHPKTLTLMWELTSPMVGADNAEVAQ